MLEKRYRKDNDRQEWALVSKSKPPRVLYWFGTKKPSKEEFDAQERRVQYFKHQSKSAILSVLRRLVQ